MLSCPPSGSLADTPTDDPQFDMPPVELAIVNNESISPCLSDNEIASLDP